MKITSKIVIAFLLALGACTDVLEEDISDDKVEIILPQADAASEDGVISFWWEPVEGATAYELVFVEGTFEAPLRRAGQVAVTSGNTSYDSTFSKGAYTWSIKALNTGFATEPTLSTFSVLENIDLDLSTTTVLLNDPADNAAINTTTLKFSWQAVDAADSYFFQLAKEDFSDLNNITENKLLTNPEYEISGFEEGSYAWRVRAENIQSVSPYTMSNFEIDLTAPSPPTLLEPMDNATLALPIEMSWQAETGTQLLELSLDENFQSVAYTYELTQMSFSFLQGNAGEEYFWRVKNYDAAGNESAYSAIRSFVIQ